MCVIRIVELYKTRRNTRLIWFPFISINHLLHCTYTYPRHHSHSHSIKLFRYCGNRILLPRTLIVYRTVYDGDNNGFHMHAMWYRTNWFRVFVCSLVGLLLIQILFIFILIRIFNFACGSQFNWNSGISEDVMSMAWPWLGYCCSLFATFTMCNIWDCECHQWHRFRGNDCFVVVIWRFQYICYVVDFVLIGSVCLLRRYR